MSNFSYHFDSESDITVRCNGSYYDTLELTADPIANCQIFSIGEIEGLFERFFKEKDLIELFLALGRNFSKRMCLIDIQSGYYNKYFGKKSYLKEFIVTEVTYTSKYNRTKRWMLTIDTKLLLRKYNQQLKKQS